MFGAPAMTGERTCEVAIGLDVGTSGVKALLVRANGQPVAEATASYPLHAPRPGWAEQDPVDWWRAAVIAIRELLARRPDARVTAIGLSGQMHGVVLVDDELEPVRPALLWCDGRAGAEAAETIAQLGRDELIRRSGNRPMPGFTGPQLRWLAHNGGFGSARWVLCAKDFVRARLTGVAATDPSDASGTGLWGVDGDWDEELAGAYQVQSTLLPPVVESGAAAGVLSTTAAAELHLLAGIPVATGAADNAAAALGTAIVRPGRLLLSIGSSGTIVAPLERPRPDETGRCHLFRHAVANVWYSMAVVVSAGAALSWWSRVVGRSLDELAAEAVGVPPGSEGVIALPFLSGRRMPVVDPGARGALVGMSLAHGPGHLTRAVVEGATYAMAEGLGCIRDLGIGERDAVLTGRAVRHPLWREAVALALPDLRPHSAVPEGGAALGAAILGFAATGADAGELATRTVRHEAIEIPASDVSVRHAIAVGFERYRALASTASSSPEEQR